MAKDKDDRIDTGLLGKDIDREFWQLIDSPYLSESDIRFATTKFIRTPSHRETVWNNLRMVKKGIYKDKEGEAHKETDPGANDAFMDFFKEHLMDCFSDMIHHIATDHLTRASILARRRGGVYKHFDFFNPKIFVSWVEPGACGYCIGTQGSGKTSLAEKIAEWCHEHYEMKVISGIPLTVDPPDWYFYCNRGSHLLRTACILANQGINCIVLIDEAYTVLPGQKPLDPRVMAWTQLGRLNRKLGITQFVVGHRINDIHSDIKKWATFRVNKLTRRHPDRMFMDMMAIVDGGTEKLKDYVKKVPLPDTLKFDTRAIATFRMDFEPEQLSDHLGRLEHGINQFKAAIEWFDNQQDIYYDQGQKDDLCNWLINQCGLRGDGVRMLSRKFGVTPKTIYQWAKKRSRAIAMGS